MSSKDFEALQTLSFHIYSAVVRTLLGSQSIHVQVSVLLLLPFQMCDFGENVNLLRLSVSSSVMGVI